MKTAIITFLASLVTFDSIAADAPTTSDQTKKDPIIGRWRWSVNNFMIDIRADGSTQGPEPHVGAGVWKTLPTREAERKYQISWRGGAIVDVITLEQGGKKLRGKNHTGHFTAARVD